MKPVDTLRNDLIDAKPEDYDWSEGFGETWDIVAPFSAMDADDLCNFIEERTGHAPDGWVETPEGWRLMAKADEEDEENALRDQCWDCMETDDFAPMMNYYYPAPDQDAAVMQATLHGVVPLVVVLLRGEPVLALSGGGMDLSWEICEAYMHLGYLPPVHFARNLPRMAGRGPDAKGEGRQRDRWILEGCARACAILEGWSGRGRGEAQDWIAQMDLDDLEEDKHGS